DFQVKIRGFRIEPGEIEAALAAHPDVAQAAVIVEPGGSGGPRLVGYLVPAGAAAPSVRELRGHLEERLPAYMVPAAFITLPAMPLTPNGKLDRKALPGAGQGAPADGGDFVAPRTPVEELLAELWSGLLAVERVGAHDDFFQLGGHSLLVSQLVSRIRDTFRAELPLRRVF